MHVTDVEPGLSQVLLSNESNLDSSVWDQVICSSSSSSFLDHPSWTPDLITQASDILVIHLNKIIIVCDALLHNLLCCFFRQHEYIMAMLINIHLD